MLRIVSLYVITNKNILRSSSQLIAVINNNCGAEIKLNHSNNSL